ncbi:tudor domain-containing protein [Sandaracinus amylolyticus]|uniref:tudor domain-containing protein n=1 Tax=Sandaracinus amylolyticus TaxID=927083 RepID=UPI001F31CF80|nr:tudor domain-containing protein [Sandaracinus amylolyticus]
MLAVSLAGCASSAPRPEVPTRPERLVMVVGEKSDAIGIEQARDPSRTVVEVAFHDGARAWVEEWRVRDLDLPAGARVVVRREGALAVTTLVERVDRMAWIAGGETPTLVSIGDLIAVLRRSDVVDAPAEDDDDTDEVATEPPPPIDPARVVAYDGPEVWLVARLAACSASDATLITADRAEPLVVSFDRIAPLVIDAGDRVWAPWQGTSYRAIVIETRGEVVHLRWEDGSDAWMPASDVRRVLREASPSSGRARRPAVCSARAAPVLVHVGRTRVAGVIESCDETHATLALPEGAHERRARTELTTLALAPGDTIDATWRGSGDYVATVVALEGGSLQVRWEDGSEETIPLATVISALEPAGETRPRGALVCP